MWWQHLAATAHHLAASEGATDTTAPSGSNGGEGGLAGKLISYLAGSGTAIVLGILTYLGTRNRNRTERADTRQDDEQSGEVKYRLGELEGHRDDEREARAIQDKRIDALEGTVGGHDARLTALEAGRQRRPVRARRPPGGGDQ